MDIGPCTIGGGVLEVVNSIGLTVTSCLTIYLASARIRANRDLEMRFRELQLRMDHSTNKIVDSVASAAEINSAP